MPQDYYTEPDPAPLRLNGPQRGLDPATRRLMAIAGGLGGALALIVGAWSLAGHRHGPVPLIAADPGPVKVKPVNPGGLQVAGADAALLGAATLPAAPGTASGTGAGSAETLSPPPETPAPAELHRLQSSPAPPAPTMAPALASAAAAPHPAAIASPAKPAAVSAAGHDIEVQLAALPTEAQAREEWARLEKRFPAQFAHRKALISRVVSHDGHVFWRLRAGGFGDTAQAREFCAYLRGKSTACAVAAF